MVSDWFKTTARATTFSNSRMFPGQAYRRMASMVSGLNIMPGRFASLAWPVSRKT